MMPRRRQRQMQPSFLSTADPSRVAKHPADCPESMILTENGKGHALLHEIADCHEIQETSTMLKILALGHQEVATGKFKPFAEAVARIGNKTS